jgi:hypothetical protein
VISCSIVKLASGECHGCRVLENCIGGLSLCSKEELALLFVTRSSDMVSGADSTGEVQGPTLQGENSRSGLNWLCLAIALLKALFYECGLFSKVKT